MMKYLFVGQSQIWLVVFASVQQVLTFGAAGVEFAQSKLIDKCCQIGKEQATLNPKFDCKMTAHEALLTGGNGYPRNPLLAKAARQLLSQDSTLADQCEMVLESCCVGYYRTKNCNSGKQLAKEGASCMDVELSKEATIATESFNDCCMSCSLGILAARNPVRNETTQSIQPVAQRCKLLKPLASSLSGQLYEQTYVECCQEHLPRELEFIHEPGTPIDCSMAANPCEHKCVPGSGSAELSPSGRRRISVASIGEQQRDRCECFSGYRLASDGATCEDIDECKTGIHTCNRVSEICDNVKGSFRCLAHAVSEFSHAPSDDIGPTSDFTLARLCPLGQRWDSREGKCLGIPSGGGGSSSSISFEARRQRTERQLATHSAASLSLNGQGRNPPESMVVRD